MKSNRSYLTGIIFWTLIVSILYMVENLPLFGTTSTAGGFTDFTFGIVSFISVSFLILYYVLEYRRERIKRDNVIFIILLVLFLWFSITMWTTNSHYEFSNIERELSLSTDISIGNKIRYQFELIIIFSTIYTIFHLYGRKIKNAKQMLWIPKLIVFVIFALTIVSFFTDAKVYKDILTNGDSMVGIMSVFDNENVFALWCLFAMISSYILCISKPKWWTYVSAIYFFIFMIFTSSATSLAIGAISLIIFGIIEIVYLFRNKKKKTAIVSLSLAVGSALLITVMYLLGLKFGWKLTSSINYYFSNYVFYKDVATLTSRTFHWSAAANLLLENPFRFLFGYGFRTDLRIYKIYHDCFCGCEATVRTVHSGYVTVLLRFGLIGLILYGLVFALYIAAIITLIVKKRVKYALIYGLSFACIACHQILESTVLFDLTTSGMVILFLIFLPPLFTLKHILRKDEILVVEDPKPLTNYFNYQRVGVIISSITISIVICFFVPFLTSYPYVHFAFGAFVFMLLIALLLVWLFVPYTVSLYFKNTTITKGTYRLIINALLVIALVGLVFIKSFEPPIMAFGAVLLGECVIYTAVKKGSLKEWYQVTFDEPLRLLGITPIITILFTCLLANILSQAINLDKLNFILIIGVGLFEFYIAFLLIPNKSKTELLDELNENIKQRENKMLTEGKK